MPLIDHPTLRNKKIPDEKGGWYWFKRRNSDWVPIEVEPADSQTGWPQGIHSSTHFIAATDVHGEWGSQIDPEADQKLAAIIELLTTTNLEDKDGELQKELRERGCYQEAFYLLGRASIREELITKIRSIVLEK